jgi:hypothetical protein
LVGIQASSVVMPGDSKARLRTVFPHTPHTHVHVKPLLSELGVEGHCGVDVAHDGDVRERGVPVVVPYQHVGCARMIQVGSERV